ncbi:MAG: peroxiredoxin [Trueperaceae bacterium]
MSTEPGIGDAAPSFDKQSTHGPKRLEDYRGKWLVIYFYPNDETTGCTTEACDFRDLLPGLDAEVLGVSPDTVESHRKFQENHSLPFPLLADEDHGLAEAYGAWGEKQNYGRTSLGLIRSTFIIDPQGNIAEAMRNVKATGHAERVGKRLGELRG